MNDIFQEAYTSGTDLSKAGNRLLGDRTGRTITRTHMDGLAILSDGIFKPSGEIVHLFMVFAIIGLLSRNRTILDSTFFVIFLLLITYFAGRE